MDGFICPVDVISVCNADGQIRPIRLQLYGAQQNIIRMDIEEILSIKDIPYIGVEASIFICRAKTADHRMIIELKYVFRSHTWFLIRRLY